jgi:hypothetical protein
VTPLYRAGQFVWCRFPTAERPLVSGPKLRIGYILDVSPSRVTAVLYTTTTRWVGDRVPLGVIPIDERAAQKLGQKPFVIDLRCAAFIPITSDFFPRLDHAERGVQGEAPAGLTRQIAAVLTEMQRRQVTIEVRGPGRRR